MKIVKIGRSNNCDIVLNDAGISREHAEIFIDDEGNIFITDLKSANGTFINGVQLYGSEILNFTDQLRLGNFNFNWQAEVFTEEVTNEDFVCNRIESKIGQQVTQEPVVNSEQMNLSDNKSRKRNVYFALSFFIAGWTFFGILNYIKPVDTFIFPLVFILLIYTFAVSLFVIELFLFWFKISTENLLVIIGALFFNLAIIISYIEAT